MLRGAAAGATELRTVLERMGEFLGAQRTNSRPTWQLGHLRKGGGGSEGCEGGVSYRVRCGALESIGPGYHGC